MAKNQPEETPDPELQKLVAELGNKEPLPVGDISSTPVQAQPTSLPTPPSPEPQLNEIQSKHTVKPSKKKGKTDEDYDREQQEANDLADKYTGVIKKFGQVADQILNTYQQDRAQIQEAIDHYKDVVTTGGKVPRAYVEGWTQALQTLANTNSSAVKVLDSFAKFMAAGKNSEVFNKVNVNFNTADLLALLDKDKYPDETDDK